MNINPYCRSSGNKPAKKPSPPGKRKGFVPAPAPKKPPQKKK